MVIVAVLAWVHLRSPISAGDTSEIDVSQFTDAAAALQAGEKLETARQWVEAITHYEAVLDRFDKNDDLIYALRRTRIHFGVDRRYSDRSFDDQLLSKGRAESLDLFEDILTRVQYEYVEAVSVTRFVAHGTESLYMALKNERFLGHIHLFCQAIMICQRNFVKRKQSE